MTPARLWPPFRLLPVLLALASCAGCSQLELGRLYFANNGADVRLEQPLPLSIPFRDVDGWVVVQASVNGKEPIDVVLDTGASLLAILDGARTAHLGLDMRAARRLGEEGDVAAPFGARQDGLELDFGPFALEDHTALAIPVHTIKCRGADMPDPPFQGVLGHELFHRFVVEFDYDAARVVLHDPKTWQVPDGAWVVPAEISGRQPFVHARIASADGGSYEARLHVDTGAGIDLSLFPQANPAIRVPAEGEESQACFVGGLATYRSGNVSLGLADAPALPTPALYSTGKEVIDAGQHGRIGARFLRRYNVVFDYANERMVLMPRRGVQVAEAR